MQIALSLMIDIGAIGAKSDCIGGYGSVRGIPRQRKLARPSTRL